MSEEKPNPLQQRITSFKEEIVAKQTAIKAKQSSWWGKLFPTSLATKLDHCNKLLELVGPETASNKFKHIPERINLPSLFMPVLRYRVKNINKIRDRHLQAMIDARDNSTELSDAEHQKFMSRYRSSARQLDGSLFPEDNPFNYYSKSFKKIAKSIDEYYRCKDFKLDSVGPERQPRIVNLTPPKNHRRTKRSKPLSLLQQATLNAQAEAISKSGASEKTIPAQLREDINRLQRSKQTANHRQPSRANTTPQAGQLGKPASSGAIASDRAEAASAPAPAPTRTEVKRSSGSTAAVVSGTIAAGGLLITGIAHHTARTVVAASTAHPLASFLVVAASAVSALAFWRRPREQDNAAQEDITANKPVHQ
jgi:hypothetical protein